MNFICSLALKELKSNKKMTITIIISIILVTILINSIVTLALSYQDYVVNLLRSHENWEAIFNNVPYKYIKYLEEDSNIKQTAIIQDLGKCEYNNTQLYNELHKNSDNVSLHVVAFDYNALKNFTFQLESGRIPQNSNEIIVDINSGFKIGDTINTTSNNQSLNVVGKFLPSTLDYIDGINIVNKNGNSEFKDITGMTVCNRENITPQENVLVYVISNDISQIYICVNRIIENIKSIEPNFNIDVIYNTELLSYAGVAEEGSDFHNTIIFTVSLLILIIAISSIALIYSIFNISITEKKKYIASLSSIGASKKQIFKIYFLQAFILTIISISSGLVINFVIDSVLINYLNQFIKSAQLNLMGTYLSRSADVSLNMIYSSFVVYVSIILVTLIVFVSIFKPLVNISKTTIIDLIRKNNYNKITSKTIKTPKFISGLFNITGELAYKNVRRSRYKYVSIITSITISIVLFLSINTYVSNLNLYNTLPKTDYNYTIHIRPYNATQNYSNEVLNYISELGLIDSYYGISSVTKYAIPGDENIHSSLKNVADKIEKNYKYALGKNQFGSIELPVNIIALDDNTYKDYLKQLNGDISLDKYECILVNYTNVKTKYYDDLYLTNYKPGDTISLNNYTRFDKDIISQISNIMSNYNSETTTDNLNTNNLYIKAVSNIIPKGADQDKFGTTLYLIVNLETYKVLHSKLLYNINTSNANELTNVINELNIKYDKLFRIFNTDYTTEQQSAENTKHIKEVLLYSFTIFISILATINVFNIIVSSIILRKYEFAELVAIGMSKKQLNKMLRLEGLFYGTTSLIFGIFISLIISYIFYKKMVDNFLYAFSVPYFTILLLILIIYLIIYISIRYAKKQFNIENISEIIKER